jgi:phosphonate transport system permease protein
VNAAAVAYLRDAALQTVGIASAGLILALLIGTPLALIIARGGVTARIVSAFVAVVRAIPDLVLALVAVVAVGLGVLPGILALGISYGAVIAKVFAELLGSVRRDAAEALRATGATANASFLIGMLPAAWPGLVSFGAYAFESIMRASVIVGVVGAGGIGAQLMVDLNLGNYRIAGIDIAVLIILVLGCDVVSRRLRSHAQPFVVGLALAGVAVVGIVALALGGDPPWATIAQAPRNLVRFAAEAWPPEMTARIAFTALHGVVETLVVAVVGTLVGALFAIPIGWFAAADARARATLTRVHVGGRIAQRVSSLVLACVRSVPPLVIALVGLSVVGLGPRAGIFALAIYTAGVLGKLLAESLELAERAPSEALSATGATPRAAALVALVPTAATAMIAHVLYRFEWNVRASTTLGMIGAGGLGQAIYNAQQLFFDRELITYVGVAILLVLIIDALGARLRSRFHLATLER